MDELGIGDQLRQLERQRAVLLEDQNIIRGQMNRLDSGHNLILTEFYISHKKWHEVQQKVPYSVQHLKYLRTSLLHSWEGTWNGSRSAPLYYRVR